MVGTDSSEKIVTTRLDSPRATVGHCVVYSITPIEDEISDNFSGFDALVAEFESDPAFKEELGTARKWVGDKFYEGGSLSTLRLRVGLSQRQLAEACGISQPHVARYEAGRVVPGLDISAVMAKALGVEMNEFEKAWQATKALRGSKEGDTQ